MSGIGEKIKEKLHLGHDSGHDQTRTVAHETPKTTAAPDVAQKTTEATGSPAHTTTSPTVSTGAPTTAYGHTPAAADSHVGGTNTGPAATSPVGPGTYQATPKMASQEEGGARAEGERRGTVCATKYYTTVEDRPVEKEIIERVVEHRPVEKKFVVETRPAGEHELPGKRREESIGVREEIKKAAPKPSPCAGSPELVLQK